MKYTQAADGSTGRASPTERTVYRIKDTDGVLVAMHEHVKDTKTGEKQCYWQQPDGTPGLNGTPLADLPLYGVHELDNEAVLTILVEGEKARDALAEALKDAPVNVLGTVTGASGTPSLNTIEVLHGHEVVLWPDNDEPGHKHMDRISERLQGIAAKVRLFDWPEAKEKGDDAADHPAIESGEEKALGILLNDLCGAPEYVPPEPEPEVEEKRRAYALTDLGNSERLIDRHGEDLRYIHPWGRYLVYDGTRWRVDDNGAVRRMAKDTVRTTYGEAKHAPDEATRKATARHAMRSESGSRIREMIDLAKDAVPVAPAQLDADPWLLNVENGTIDLRTGELHPHNRGDLITKIAPVEYDPDATAPTFEVFLEKVLPIEALRKFVQKAIGYSLTGDVSEHALFFLHGSGANGKTTLMNVVLGLTGDYGKQAAPDLLVAKGNSHPTELADLFGARCVASTEVEDGRKLAENLTKQLTGGDKIKARRMREDFWEFNPTHKIWLSANHKPEVRGTDYAIWRRIKLIPFGVTIRKEDQDSRLPEKLKEELPGILAWAVRGCLEWQAEGLGEPKEVTQATESYRAEQDVLAAFIEECCWVDRNAQVKFKDLWTAYQDWCQEAGERPESKMKFGKRLDERGFESRRGGKNVALRAGLGLLHEEARG